MTGVLGPLNESTSPQSYVKKVIMWKGAVLAVLKQAWDVQIWWYRKIDQSLGQDAGNSE
jgi:hypothetical protein